MRYLVSIDSLGFIADGIHTLDNRRPNMPFDYVGQAGNDYTKYDYDYARAGNFGDSHGFASWRLDCCYTIVYFLYVL